MVIFNSLDEVAKRIGIEENGPVQKFLVSTCQRYMDEYIPKNLGNLRTIIYMGDNSITYMSPYASYQYYGMRKDETHVVNPENYTTPGTGPFWDARMLSVHKDDIKNNVEKYLRRGI